MKIHLLTKGFHSSNAQAFLFPLIKYRKNLREYGIDLKFFHKETSKLTQCDVLMMEGAWFRNDWMSRTDQVIQKLKQYKSQVKVLHYYDIMDSSGMPHVRALPYVDRYFKSYLLKDRSQYLKPWYGHRVYSDYFYRNFNIRDREPSRSEPVEDAGLLKRLGVSWSSGLANYAYQGLYRNEFYRCFSIKTILKFPKCFISPDTLRSNPLFCRLGTAYSRDTIAYQRKKIVEKLSSKIPTNRVTRKRYFHEMANSRLAISPFGYGEVCYRDYEVFISGATLLKPDMSHMETWPNLYHENETVLFHRWDLSDFEEKLDWALSNSDRLKSIAKDGQENYRDALIGSSAADKFCQHFHEMLTEKV